jgi:hypothetical protein
VFRLRSRAWIAGGVFLATFAIVAAWVSGQTKIYSASATVQVLPPHGGLLSSRRPHYTIPEMQAQAVGILKSAEVAQRTLDRLRNGEGGGRGEEGDKGESTDFFRRFMAPYQKSHFRPESSPIEILERNRRIIFFRKSLIFGVTFRHPDRFVAARVANLLAEEFHVCARLRQLGIDETFSIIERPYLRADQWADFRRENIKELEREIREFRAPRRPRNPGRKIPEGLCPENRKALDELMARFPKTPPGSNVSVYPRLILRAMPARKGEYVLPKIPAVLCAGAALGCCLVLACGCRAADASGIRFRKTNDR